MKRRWRLASIGAKGHKRKPPTYLPSSFVYRRDQNAFDSPCGCGGVWYESGGGVLGVERRCEPTRKKAANRNTGRCLNKHEKLRHTPSPAGILIHLPCHCASLDPLLATAPKLWGRIYTYHQRRVIIHNRIQSLLRHSNNKPIHTSTSRAEPLAILYLRYHAAKTAF